MYTKENLLHVQQLELIYKSCLLTLRDQGISYDDKHTMLSDVIPDMDSVELLDTIEIVRDLLLQNEKYNDIEMDEE